MISRLILFFSTNGGNYAYTNPSILPNEELAQRGFQQFSGHSGSGVIITDTMMQNTMSPQSNQQFDIKWNNSRDPVTQNNSDNVFNQNQGDNNDVNNIHEARTYFQD